MESVVVDGFHSLSITQNSVSSVCNNPPSTSGTRHPSQTSSPSQSRDGGASSTYYSTVQTYGASPIYHPNDSVIVQKSSFKAADDNRKDEESLRMAKHYYESKGKSEFEAADGALDKSAATSSQKNVSKAEEKSCDMIRDPKNCDPSGRLESEFFGSNPCDESVEQQNCHSTSQSAAMTSCPSPQNSLYSATVYSEAKQSFTNTEVSECTSSAEKSGESIEVKNSCEFNESRKTSICRGSTGSDVSDDSSSSCLSNAMYKPHKANDIRWEAIQAVRSRYGMLGLSHFKLLRKLGCGDIGSVYLSELSGTRTFFAMKVMDKAALANRKKLPRAQTEREILQSLDHPFLPTLYTHFETEKFSCLVMEFCPGGDLHALRQRQPGKYFSEYAARLGIPFPFLFFPMSSNSIRAYVTCQFYAIYLYVTNLIRLLAIRTSCLRVRICKFNPC